MKIKKFNEELDKFSQEEDWEEVEENDEYVFLRNLQKFLNQKSFPKKSTRKFLKMAYDLVQQGEISQKTLDDFINQEDLNPDIVEEIKGKIKGSKPLKRPRTRSDDDDYDYDGCGGGTRRVDPCGGFGGGYVSRGGC